MHPDVYSSIINNNQTMEKEPKCPLTDERIKKMWYIGGTWVAQSVNHLTLDFGSGRDLRVMGLSPTLGSVLSGESAYPSPPAHAFSLSKINNFFKCGVYIYTMEYYSAIKK